MTPDFEDEFFLCIPGHITRKFQCDCRILLRYKRKGNELFAKF